MTDEQSVKVKECTYADKARITELLTQALAHADTIAGLEMTGIHICTALDTLATHSTVESRATTALFQP
jgi:hypothetical protein